MAVAVSMSMAVTVSVSVTMAVTVIVTMIVRMSVIMISMGMIVPSVIAVGVTTVAWAESLDYF